MLASMTEQFDPYPPMEATLRDHHEQDEQRSVEGTYSFGAVVRGTVLLLKRHLFWGVVALLIPAAGSFVVELVELLGGEVAGLEIASGAIGVFVVAPWSLGASAALNWRMLGSTSAGQLRRGPVAGAFYGFRFFGLYLLFGLAIAGVVISLSIVPFSVYVVWLQKNFQTVGLAEQPVAWAVFCVTVTAALVVVVVVSTRWSVVIPLAIAEGGAVSAAFKASSSLVKGRFLSVCGFVLLMAAISQGLPAALGAGVSVAANAGGGDASPIALLGPVLNLPLALVCSGVGAAGPVALYRVLRATAAPEPR